MGLITGRKIRDKLSNLIIGLPNGTVLCDFCNTKLGAGEEVRVLYAKLAMSEAEYKYMLQWYKKRYKADRVLAPTTTEDIWVGCLGCLGNKLNNPTLGTDEWIFKAVLAYENKRLKLTSLKAIYHSPPEEGI